MRKDDAVRRIVRTVGRSALTVVIAGDRLADAARKTGVSIAQLSACMEKAAPSDTRRERPDE